MQPPRLLSSEPPTHTNGPLCADPRGIFHRMGRVCERFLLTSWQWCTECPRIGGIRPAHLDWSIDADTKDSDSDSRSSTSGLNRWEQEFNLRTTLEELDSLWATILERLGAPPTLQEGPLSVRIGLQPLELQVKVSGLLLQQKWSLEDLIDSLLEIDPSLAQMVISSGEEEPTNSVIIETQRICRAIRLLENKMRVVRAEILRRELRHACEGSPSLSRSRRVRLIETRV